MTTNENAAPGWLPGSGVENDCASHFSPASAHPSIGPAPTLDVPPIIDWIAPGAHALLSGLASARLSGKLTDPASVARGIGPECWAPFEAVIQAVQARLMEKRRQ